MTRSGLWARGWLLGLSLLVISLDASAFSVSPIQIRVVNELSEGLAAAVVRINGVSRPVEANGSLVAEVEKARLYTLEIAAPGYYSILQTIGEQERERWRGSVPDVVLVRKKPGRVMLAFGGDVMLGRRYHEPNPGEPRYISAAQRAADTRELLRVIRPYLRLADHVSVNLESPVVAEEPAEKADKNVVFYSYPETLDALTWAGVDYVSLGNNHIFDYLEAAMEETLGRLGTTQLGYSGAGATETQALQPWVSQVVDETYSFHGFVGWEGRVTPNQVAVGADKGGAALGSSANIARSLQLAESAAVSVVQYHGSDEYTFAPTDETRRRLRRAIDDGADLVIGHHPHVLHGFEVYKGRLIAYSLGNFLFDQYIYETQRSALLYVWMDGDRFHRAEIVPLYIKGYRPTPAVGDMRSYVLRRAAEQARHEAIAIGYSGGHVTLHESPVELAGPQGQFRRFPHREASTPAAPEAGRPARCEYGYDWWAMGDFEQEGLYGLHDLSWDFSTERSGVSFDVEAQNYLVAISSDEQGRASMGQKYFLRVWDEHPKSVMLKVRTSRAARVSLCLEKRTLAMSISQGRAAPEVSCLAEVSVAPANDWQPLAFDFIPPARETLRGLRFRLHFDAEEAATYEVDDIKFVSWSELDDDRRISIKRCEPGDAKAGLGSAG